jgi:hypothetical protein
MSRTALQSFDVANGPVEVDKFSFNKLCRSLQGIAAISHILNANMVAQEDMDGTPFNNNTVGGLTDAIQVLSEYSLNAMEQLAERQERAAQQEASHE